MTQFGVYRIQFGTLPTKVLDGLYLRPDGGERVYVVEEEDGTVPGKLTEGHLVGPGESVKPVDLDQIGGEFLFGRFDQRFPDELERFKGDYSEVHNGITYFWLRDPDRVVGCVRLSDRESVRCVSSATG